MCLILFAYDTHPKYRLILAANRDEFYSRPTEPAKFWEDHPSILAGRDLEALGTWIGLTGKGRFAAVTNYRAPALAQKKVKSRGEVVSRYLLSTAGPRGYLEQVKKECRLYNPFNLLAGDKTSLYFYSTFGNRVEKVTAGIHGLSNHLLDTPWPKVIKGKKALCEYLENNDKVDTEPLFNILADTTRAPDDELPDTGVSVGWERQLSSIFIKGIEYGTLSSTVVLIDRSKHVRFIERSFNSNQVSQNEVSYEFDIDE